MKRIELTMVEFHHILPYETQCIYFTIYGIHILIPQIKVDDYKEL